MLRDTRPGHADDCFGPGERRRRSVFVSQLHGEDASAMDEGLAEMVLDDLDDAGVVHRVVHGVMHAQDAILEFMIRFQPDDIQAEGHESTGVQPTPMTLQLLVVGQLACHPSCLRIAAAGAERGPSGVAIVSCGSIGPS